MKKIFTFILAFALIFALIGCVNKESAANNGSTAVVNPTYDSEDNMEPTEQSENREVIPEGMTYYQRDTWTQFSDAKSYQYDRQYNPGDYFPTLQDGDMVVSDGVVFVYNAELDFGDWRQREINGWGVGFTNDVQGKTITLPRSINGVDVVSLRGSFYNTTIDGNVEIYIPNNVMNIEQLLHENSSSGIITLVFANSPIEYGDCFSSSITNQTAEDGTVISISPLIIIVKGNVSEKTFEHMKQTSRADNVFFEQ